MKKLYVTMVAVSAFAATAFAGAPHAEVGATAQDEAVATAIDEGLTQAKYLALAYGENAEKMLADAFAARGAYFTEGGTVVRHLADGDIRNVPCIENVKGVSVDSFFKFKTRNKSAFFKPTDITPVSGRMYGVSNAFDTLMFKFREKVKRDIVVTGEGKSTYRDEFDPNATSYSFWPIGLAIHANDAYAEEAAHFFNFVNPRTQVRSFKGNWSNKDFEKVAKWNEFLAALRGLKVYAYSLGYNLNDDPPTSTQTVVDGNGNTTTNEVVGQTVFVSFYNVIQGKMARWMAQEKPCPLATNAFILLLAYKEAAEAENTPNDSAVYKRLRNLCRDNNIAKMVL